MTKTIMELEYDEETGEGRLKCPPHIWNEPDREKTLVSLLLLTIKDACRLCDSPFEYMIAELIVANSRAEVMEQIRAGGVEHGT